MLQHHPAGVPDPEPAKSKKGLIAFDSIGWKERLRREAVRRKNELLTPVRITQAVEDWHAAQPPATPPPVVTDHPVDPELQTGEAAKLGGAMSIHAPWKRDQSDPPA